MAGPRRGPALPPSPFPSARGGRGQDAAAGRSALQFFHWAYANGDKMADELDYVPMPDNVVGQVEQTWSKQFAPVNGQPLWTGGKQ